MNTEDDLQAALAVIADGAAGPEPILTNFRRDIRVHQQRRALLTVGGVAAGVAAVGAPAFILLSARDRRDDSPPAGREPRERGRNAWAPMLLRPTWLPDGMVEIAREAEIGRVWQSRHWVSPEYFTADLTDIWEKGELPFGGVALTVRPASDNPAYDQLTGQPTRSINPTGSGPNVMIGPYPGYSDGGAICMVTWRMDQWLIEVEVNGIGANEDDALRVARSVVVDDRAELELSIGFGWLPPALGTRPVKLDFTYRGPQKWNEMLSVFQLQGASVEVQRGRSGTEKYQPGADDKPHTLRGLPGYVGIGSATVSLPDGSTLYVRAGDQDPAESQATAIRVIEQLIVIDNPDRGWAGRR